MNPLLEYWAGQLYQAAISKDKRRLDDTTRIVREKFEADQQLKAAAIDELARLSGLLGHMGGTLAALRRRDYVGAVHFETLSKVLNP